MVTSSVPIQSMAEARGHLNIALTYTRAGSGTWEAVDHLRKVLEYVLERLDQPTAAQAWEEGRLVGYNETGGDTPNPYASGLG